MESIQRAIEEDGILLSQVRGDKLGSVYNMDHTAIFIDITGKTLIDYSGSITIDVHQGTETNGFRASCLLASLVVQCRKKCESLRFATLASITQSRKSMDWKPTITGWWLLLLDRLKVHTMDSVCAALEDQCTQVEFVSPGITGLCQPMDVATFVSRVSYGKPILFFYNRIKGAAFPHCGRGLGKRAA
ncbi:hypothetical protein PHMEG_00012429 [Phytophthora megakarya]|uniref:DDE-1 domain-containing protein n=1 Tax=Phytophthora megakarya TaxID=4795 RepID=A0A225W8R6_9STRA|nr:hypothetical protein PHMEG_00012429 [Phytophthora megakarya]